MPRKPRDDLKSFLNKVRELKARGFTWAQCGEALGVSGETVRTRFRYHTDPEFRRWFIDKLMTYKARRALHATSLRRQWESLRAAAQAQAREENLPVDELYTRWELTSFSQWKRQKELEDDRRKQSGPLA